MRIFVGSSASEDISKEYMDDCRKMLEVVLKEHDLVFGACNLGLMGISYEIAKKNHRSVTGICPEFYQDSLKEIDCDQEVLTTTMLDSTLKIYQNCDAMLFLPGGFGTIYEFFTANYSKICKDVDVPIILYDCNGFYDEIVSFIDKVHQAGFIKDKQMDQFKVAHNAEEVLSYLK
ncbi:MAG: LOG family protein [Bacilli bacterium]|nr:LOG family protein [Bacilli bacterium]